MSLTPTQFIAKWQSTDQKEQMRLLVSQMLANLLQLNQQRSAAQDA